jgi:hypothetical protein
MSCILNAGVTLPCRELTGGVQKLYIGTFSGSTAWTKDATNVLTGVTGFNAFYEFEFPLEQTEVVEAGNFSTENQTVFYEQTVNSVMYSTTQETRDALALLGMSRLFVIIKDQNGQYFLYGKDNGAWLTTANISTGKAFSDLNGITFSIVGREPNPGNEVDASVMTVLGF